MMANRCECEWLGDCACEVRDLPRASPAKLVKIRLKTGGRGVPVKESATASESTPIKE
jgi:hypothetical protein